MPIEGKPEAHALLVLRDQLLKVWAQAHSNWEEWDSFYNLTYPVWTEQIHQNRARVVPSTARNVVDHAVDAELSISLSVHKNPVGEGAEHKRKADKAEEFLTALDAEASLREPGITAKQLTRNLTLYGYAVSYGPTLDLTDRPEEPELEEGEDEAEFERRQRLYRTEQRMWLPIRWRAPHPRRVLLDPLERQPTEGMLLDTRFAKDLERLTQKKKDQGRIDYLWVRPFGKDDYEKIEVVEYYNREYHCMVDKSGQLIFQEKNTWGFVPFSQAFSGWGQETMGGDSIGIRPEDLAVGILKPVIGRIRQEAQLVSAMQEMVMKAAYARRGTTKEAGEAVAALAGGVLTGSKKEDWWSEEYPKITTDMFEALQECKRDIEEGTFARLLGGERPAGVPTLGGLAILSDKADKKFHIIREQMGMMGTTFLSNVLRLVDALGETVTVRGVSFGPEDIDDYSVRAEYKQVDLVMQLQVEQEALARYNAGLLSKDSFWDMVGAEDATKERDRLLEDKVWDDPDMVALGKAEAEKALGVHKALENLRAERKKQLAASPPPGQPSQNGAGGIPPGAMPPPPISGMPPGGAPVVPAGGMPNA